MDGFKFNLETPLVFGVCPFQTVLNIDLRKVFKVFIRQGELVAKGFRHNLYPLYLANEENLIVPVGGFGILAFRVVRGRLVFYMPPSMQQSFESRLSEAVRGKAFRGDLDGVESVAYALTIPTGKPISIPIPMIGDLRLTAV